ncbi:MAG TPA: hypothetical protein VF535_06375 [Allosphingosinicella sp.]|jgi:hypothetical protein
MDELGLSGAYMAGAFAASLLIAFLVSRLGLYLRRSSRFETGTVAGVHAISFFLLGAAACSAGAGSPGSSAFTAFVAQAIIFLIDLLRLPRPEDYRDDVPQTLRPLAGARLAAVVASILLGFALAYGLARPPTDRDMIADLERGMNDAPGAGSYLASLKRNFPDEYRTLATESVRQMRAYQAQGKGGPAAQERLGTELGYRIVAMTASKSAALPKAPTPALNAYSRAMRDYVASLEKTAPQSCAALALGRTGGPEPALPPAAREASGRMMAARLDLARAGLDHPTERDLSTPPRKAMEMLIAEMKRRDASLASYAERPGGALILTLPKRCSLAILYYSAMADLPPETSALLTAYDLSPD